MRMRPLLLCVMALWCGCAGDAGPAPGTRPGERYGGIFNMNETEVLRSIFPLTITQVSAMRLAAQIYQGLVRFDPKDLSIKPCLAESWDVDPTATIYTFHLRRNVVFHDDAAFPEGTGRVVTAKDVVTCLTAICQRGTGDQMFWLFQDRVQGANSCFSLDPALPAEDRTVQGIQALDDSTVRITLTHPAPNFLQIIAHAGCWIYPHELVDAYAKDLMQHAIGTGPFSLKMARPGEAMVLERNANYWDKDAEGRALPYLDGVRCTFVHDKDSEVREFLAGHLSIVSELSLSSFDLLSDPVDPGTGKQRFVELSVPAFAVQFYGFNAHKPPFNDVRVRRAFALAIDRRVLVDSVLHGAAVKADHGLVAPGLTGYPYSVVPAIPFAPDSARKLLSLAGYPGGMGFPHVQLQVNSDGFGYLAVASEVQAQLERELHLVVSISTVSADRHYELIESGSALFWREGWVADHPDPENFLALLYGKNAVTDTALPASLNNTRYVDPAFDSLFASSLRSTSEAQRLQDLAEAERVAMRDLPVLPLYHERYMLLLQPRVHDLPINPIEHLDLGAVWLGAPAD